MDQFNTFDKTNVKLVWWKKANKVYIWLLVIVTAFVVGIGVGQITQKAGDQTTVVNRATTQIADLFNQSGVDPRLFKEVWDRVHTDYYDKNKIDDQKLFYGAVSGMVAALGDPHTLFFDPTLTKEFNQELSGAFYGIGAEIGRRDGLLVVIAPLADTPADRAGLKAGDKILAIDGQDATNFSTDQAIAKIRGERNTKVILTVLSSTDKTTHDVSIIRDKITVPSVTYKLENKLAIIKLSSFNEDTSEQFAKIVQKVLNDDPQGIILDLRNNPGGYLETSVQIASYWLEPGQLIVREEFSDSNQNQSHSAIRKPSLSKYKTVVLINEGSASASEILAGALKDYGLATLVGKKSYGKGSVQNLLSLSGDTSLKLTVAKWFTPKGNSIDGTGISPDQEVNMTEDDYTKGLDPQMDKAKALFKE